MIKKIILLLITLYQKVLSPGSGLLRKTGIVYYNTCTFYPTCSQYSKGVIAKYGILKGVIKSVRRVLRCHPWQRNHFDPV